MNIVSLVPSWTETLINAELSVVGRTRFCIHPKAKVKSIPAIGGTKSVNWDKLDTKPDLVILDKEENTLEMAESCPYPYYATHIKTIYDVPIELLVLADLTNNKRLIEKAYLWTKLLETKKSVRFEDLQTIGVINWWQKPNNNLKKNCVYLIWKDPYMAVGEKTFIHSVFSFLGIELYKFKADYPQLELSEFSTKNTLLLFSSEPFPFQNKKAEMMELGYDCAWIDGEKFSWFGDRSFQFLNSI